MKPYQNASARHDFLYLFDCQDGNPNGDPDNGGRPREDEETGQGQTSAESVKRKIRDYVDVAYGEQERFKIYVQSEGYALNDLQQRAYSVLNLQSTGTKQRAEDIKKAQEWMKWNFWDIRGFGAVMTTGVNCGQVKGPIQMDPTRSIDPIFKKDWTLTRIAITRIEDLEKKTTEMAPGREKVPYGLYLGRGYFLPHCAQKTGFNNDDLSLFWEALMDCWNIHHSSSSGTLAFRGAHIWTHEKPLGNAHAHRLFERLSVKLRDNVTVPRKFSDYMISIEERDLPKGVEYNFLDV